MGSKSRLTSSFTKRGDNNVNLVTSRKINTRLARPIAKGSGNGEKGDMYNIKVVLLCVLL